MSIVNVIRKSRVRAAIHAAVSSCAVLILTSVHHVYGAIIYNTPWRNHVTFISIPAAFFIVAALYLGCKYADRRLGRMALWAAIVAIGVLPFGVIGVFEGGYNHVVKDVLYLTGASRDLMNQLFPPPTYEMPNDLFFEATGVMQFFVGLFAVYFAVRLLFTSRKSPALR